MSEPTPGSPRFVERLLADRIGLDVASVGEGLIVRGVQVRMAQLGVRREEDYHRILLEPTGEVQALIEEVVIPESWFFRDDRPFAAFREFVRDGWVDRPARPAVSVLCLPCASGEEPYSVAIALLELGLPRDRFEVAAVDVSERSIRRAAAGLYGENAFRGVAAELRERYFVRAQGRYLLDPAVRTAVRFDRGNVLDPGLFADRPGFDFVFCRNLLIYFDETARARAFANLERLTALDGVLFLGHADRPDANPDTRFAPLGLTGSFAYRKCQHTAASRPAPAPVAPARPAPARAAPSRPSPPVPARAGTAPGPVPACPPPTAAARPVASPAPAAAAGPDDDPLAAVATLADQGRYVEAAQLVREQLGRGGLDARAHFLLGIIHQAAGDRAAAEAELGKAVYLDPEHDEALLALALLARRRGDVAAEALYRRRADRVLARKGRA